MKGNQVMHKPKKIILCGGGTGGHIFPMIAIAEEFKKVNSENKILFVGSNDLLSRQASSLYQDTHNGLLVMPMLYGISFIVLLESIYFRSQ